MKKQDKIHGEGNYKASKEFDDAEKAFVQSGKVEEAARNAAPKSQAEEEELNLAEQAARARSKGEDPAVRRRPSASSKKK
jgi:hypothetical protein